MKCIWFVSFPVLFFTEGCFCSIGQANITGGITFYPTIYWIRKRMKWYGKCFRYNSRWWKNKQQEHKILIQAKNQRPHKAVSSPSPPALSLSLHPLPSSTLLPWLPVRFLSQASAWLRALSGTLFPLTSARLTTSPPLSLCSSVAFSRKPTLLILVFVSTMPLPIPWHSWHPHIFFSLTKYLPPSNSNKMYFCSFLNHLSSIPWNLIFKKAEIGFGLL